MVDQLVADGTDHIHMQIADKVPWTALRIRDLASVLKDRKFDVVHPRSRLPAWICWFALQRLPDQQRPSLVTSVHGLHSVNRYSAIVGRGERVEVVSDTARRYLLSNYPGVDEQALRTIYRGVDPNLYNSSFAPAKNWERPWSVTGPDEQSITLVLAARLTRLKGHDELLDVVERLVARNLSVTALIVGGEDPRRRSYARKLRERVRNSVSLSRSVRFLGYRSDVAEIMSEADFTVSLSTKPESFGRTVLESLSLGTPVVGFDHGGVGEILRSVFPAGAVPTGDIDGVVSRLLTLRATPQTIRQHDYTLQNMCQSTLSMYEELLN